MHPPYLAHPRSAAPYPPTPPKRAPRARTSCGCGRWRSPRAWAACSWASSRSARPGGLHAPAPWQSIQKGTRVLISLWDSLMFGRVPGTRPNISESHSETSTRVPFCIAHHRIVLAGAEYCTFGYGTGLLPFEEWDLLAGTPRHLSSLRARTSTLQAAPDSQPRGRVQCQRLRHAAWRSIADGGLAVAQARTARATRTTPREALAPSRA